MGVLDEFQAAMKQVADKSGAAVVGIGGRWLRGSGLIVAKDRVLTNAHNVRGDGATVLFADDRRERGRLLAADFDGDLAVLDVPTGDARPIEWGTATPDVGAVVFAVAKASNGGTRTTFGFVSGRERAFRGPGGRLIGGSVEHTAPLAPGSSGSGIFDGEGRLIGLNTQRIGEGFYLAIPTDADLRARVDALARGEEATRPRLGVAVAPAQVARHMRRAVGLPDREGVLVRGVEEGSPAEAAGIREGDLIVSSDGADIHDADDLFASLAKAAAGKVSIGLVRGVEELTVSATLSA